MIQPKKYVFRVNYTTYDMRRDQDSLNPHTHCDVMVLSPETEQNAHPFWYARVLGVFHTKVLHTGPNSHNRSIQNMEFLWVRWIGFVPEADESPAFGFLDPSLVLRGCHLVPAFGAGRTPDLLKTVSPTAARPLGETDDWVNYYVIIWVDRDMFMRYLGGGIGHLNQGDQWTTGNNEDDMDIDSDLEEEAGNNEDSQKAQELQFQSLNNLAQQVSSNPVDEDEEDGSFGTDEDDDSENTSLGSDDEDLDLFKDMENEEEEEDFGPEDGEGIMGEDYGFGSF
ncbi:hypothetical protein BDZ94DRAFT_1287378 [Collybia nuda]|uniref:Uncharacterized protein n=1 Tax=Collybia nuda TaxID=64659 RepID=A0A9P5YI97_9AGAR|nr:hypothetical protein BDZ94DRAFT_1287378 [Collybia nuda]